VLIESLLIPKNQVTIITESTNLQTALSIMEEANFRCVPVLDSTKTYFLGNIYRMHIYRHKANGGDLSLLVTTLIKNETKFIPVNSSFFKIFFDIKDLPYISVVDEDKKFVGILTHGKLLGILEEAWSIKRGSFVLTVMSSAIPGDLAKITTIISKYSPILNCITLDIENDGYLRRSIFTLPKKTSKETVDKIIKHLETKQHKVIEVEDLTLISTT
jgi:CBS domain-containing protein